MPSVTQHNITTKRDIVRPLQYVSEGNTVTTPTSYGATPSSASFTLVGNNTEISPNLDVQHLDVAVLGSEDVIDAVKSQSLYSFGISFNPINTTLFSYGWNASASGATPNPDISLSFYYSYKLDGTTYHQHLRGCRPTSSTLSISRGMWDCNMNFICKDITIPNVTDGNTGTPTYQSSETSSSPIIHTDGGGAPFTWNTQNYGERSFSTTVTRGMSVMSVNGETDITYTKASTRSITFNADVFAGTTGAITSLYSDYEAKTARVFSYKFTTSPAKTLTYANAILTGYSENKSAGNTDALMLSISGRSESVTDL
jgi:hypothetical protein